MGWKRWGCAMALVGCAPHVGDGDAGTEEMPDPRVVLEDARYDFDSGCTPYAAASVRVIITAIDAPIESVILTSYEIHGYMRGSELTAASQEPADALPLATGESVELRFYESRDGWAGECGSWAPPPGGVGFDAVISIDGDPVDVMGTASASCGWTEC